MRIVKDLNLIALRTTLWLVGAWLGVVLYCTIVSLRVAKRFDWFSRRVFNRFLR